MSAENIYQPDINRIYSLWEFIPMIGVDLDNNGNPAKLLEFISERFDALNQVRTQPLVVIDNVINVSQYGAVLAADIDVKWMKLLLQPVDLAATIVIWGNFPTAQKESYMVHIGDEELLRWAIISPLEN